MKSMKRLLAVTLALLMCLAAAGCQAKDTTWIAKSGDETANTGLYMLYLINAYAQAMSKVQLDAASEGESSAGSSLTESEMLKAEIEGVPAEEWIVNTAKKDVERYFATNQKFEEMGLSLTEDDLSGIDYYATQMHTQSEEFLTKNSIGLESVKQYYTNNFKTNTIFMALYEEGGEKAIPASEIAAKFTELYNSTKVILIEKPIQEPEPSESSGSGSQSSAAEGSDSEAVESAQTSGEGSSAAESSASESSSGGESSSSSSEDDPEAPPEDTRTYEEKLADARARAKGYYDRALAGEDFDVLIAEWEAEDFGDVDMGHDHNEAGSHDLLTAIGGNQVPAEYARVMDAAPVGVPQMFEDDSFIYVAVRNDVMANPSLIEDYRLAVLMELRSDEFKALVEEWAAGLELEFNQDTLREFTPKKVKME